jgi:AbrB family looped-hinge helix DNA binding protein
MRITSKGQVTIPAEIREKLGLLPNTEMEIELYGAEIRLRKVGKWPRGESIVAHLKGKAERPISTDEILELTRGEA